MKLAVLLLILSVVMIVFFRFFRKNKNLENKKEDIIDLEKDPESDEYKPKDDKFDISDACFLDIDSFSNRLIIWAFRPLGDTNLFCKNHERSIVIVIISTLHANNGHIKGPPAVINSFI